MSEKNVELTFANGALTIKGEKREEREEKKKGHHMRERSLGSFERTFSVPDSIDTDKIKTSFKKGVLAVTLPKKAEARGGKEDCRQSRLIRHDSEDTIRISRKARRRRSVIEWFDDLTFRRRRV
jgi:Hsp20/alpha crystallin family